MNKPDFEAEAREFAKRTLENWFEVLNHAGPVTDSDIRGLTDTKGDLAPATAADYCWCGLPETSITIEEAALEKGRKEAEADAPPLTPEERAGIKARADAATPGPWVVVSDGVSRSVRYWGPGDRITPYHTLHTEEDAQFIAHARKDIPRLLQEIDRLAKAEARWKEHEAQLIEHLHDEGAKKLCAEADRDRLEAENKRLRKIEKEAKKWCDYLEKKGGIYREGIPGDLMDALEASREQEQD